MAPSSLAPNDNPTKFPTLTPSAKPSKYPSAIPSTSQPTYTDYASITEISVDSYTSDTITLSLTLENMYQSLLGSVYCAALTSSSTSVSAGYIKSIGTAATFELSESGDTYVDSVQILMTSLTPLQTYYIYCSSLTSTSVNLPSIDILATETTATTSCCKYVTFTNAPSYVYALIAVYDAANDRQKFIFTYELSNLPSDSITISYELPSTSESIAVSPASATFSSTSSSLVGSFYLYSDEDVSVSTMTVTLAVTGASSDEYDDVSTEVSILSSSSPLPSPVVEYALFSAAGDKVFVAFDSYTDQGSTVIDDSTATWNCSIMFSFASAQTASCTWMAANLVSISYTEYDSANTYIVPGNNITLLENSIKSQCTDSCNDNYYNIAQNITVTVPDDVVVPSVYLISPSKLSSCDNLTIDATSSSGHGGRDWASITWNVSSASGNVDTSAISEYVSSAAIVSPIAILRALLSDDETYYITLKLSNFLGNSAFQTVTVSTSSSSNIPSLAIIGSRSLSIKSSAKLEIQAKVYLSSCGVESDTTTVKYTWVIRDENNLIQNNKSISSDPSKFSLASNTLKVDHSYYVTVTADVYNDGDVIGSSSDTVTVYVAYGNVYAQVHGGYDRSDPVDRAIILDASASYDDDKTSLSYSWTCSIASLDNYGDSCSDLPSSVSSDFATDTLNIPSNTLSSSITYLFEVVVTSADGRSDSKEVYIAPSQSGAPYVLISSIISKVNHNTKLSLQGYVSANYSVQADWLVYDSTGSSVSIDSLTKSSKYFQKADVESTVSFPIAVSPYSFTAGVTYVFKLYAYPPTDVTLGSYTQMSITINSPPTAGSIGATPLTGGQALVDDFTMYSSGWVDDVEDYPLQYSFWYQLASILDEQVLAKYGFLSSLVTTLPPGLDNQDGLIRLIGFVKDSYGAESYATTSVESILSDPIDVSFLGSLLESSLASAFLSSNNDLAIASINNIAATMNAVNCTKAPSCSALYRDDCGADMDHVCGSCFSGYIGVSGSSNSKCFLENSVSGTIGSACTVNDDCIYGECSSGICTIPLASCPTNDTDLVCSGHGSCVYRDISNQKLLPSCTIFDVTCIAECECNDKYFNKYCSYAEDKALQVDDLRNTLCGAVSIVSNSSDASNELFGILVTSLKAAYSSSEVIAFESTHNCIESLENVASLINEGYIGTDSSLYTAYTSIVSSFVASSSFNTSMIGGITDSTSTLIDGVLNEMVAGQNSIDVVTSNMRISVTKQLGSDVANSTLSPPLTAAESQFGSAVSSIDFNGDNIAACAGDDGYVGMGIMLWGRNPYNDTIGSYNGSLESQLLQISATNGARRRLSATGSTSSGTPAYFINMPFTSVQNLGDETPDNVTIPDCMYYDSTLQAYTSCDSCVVSTYTNSNVTFSCYSVEDLCSGSPARRKLAAASSAVNTYGASVAVMSLYADVSRTVTTAYGVVYFVLGISVFMLSLMIIVAHYEGKYENNYINDEDEKLAAIRKIKKPDAKLKLLKVQPMDTSESVRSTEYTGTNEHVNIVKQVFPSYIWNYLFAEHADTKDSSTTLFYRSIMANHYLLTWLNPVNDTGVSRIILFFNSMRGLLLNIVVSTIFFAYYYPDTGSCQENATLTDCVASRSPLDSSTSHCRWNSDNYCELRPPPEAYTFRIPVAVCCLLIVIGMDCILDIIVNSVVVHRPDWTLLAASTKVQPTTQNSSDDKTAVNQNEHLHTDQHDCHYSYHNSISSSEERRHIIEEINSFLYIDEEKSMHHDDARATADEYIKNILVQYNLSATGEFEQLTGVEGVLYRHAEDKFDRRLALIQRETHRYQSILAACENEKSKNMFLLTSFITEQVPLVLRHYIRAMFASHAIPTVSVHPLLWLLCVIILLGFVILSLLYVLYWGTTNGGNTIRAWGINIMIIFIQDSIVNKTALVYLTYVVSVEECAKHIRGIINVLQEKSKRYNSGGDSRSRRLTSYLSPTIRSCYFVEGRNAACARLIKSLDDIDLLRCRAAYTNNGFRRVILAFANITGLALEWGSRYMSSPDTELVDFIGDLLFEVGTTTGTLFVVYGLLSIYAIEPAYIVIPLLAILIAILAVILLYVKTKRVNASSVSPGSKFDSGLELLPAEKKIIKYMSDSIRKKNAARSKSNMAMWKKNVFRYPEDHVHKSLEYRKHAVTSESKKELLDALDVIIQRYYDNLRQITRINSIDIDEYRRYKHGSYDPYLFTSVYETFIAKLYSVYYPGGTMVSTAEMTEILEIFRDSEIAVSRGCTISTFKEWLISIDSTLLRVRANYFNETNNAAEQQGAVTDGKAAKLLSRTIIRRGSRAESHASNVDDQNGALMFYKEEEGNDSENSSLSSAYDPDFEPMEQNEDEIVDEVGRNHYKSVLVKTGEVGRTERLMSTIQINRRIVVKKSLLTTTSDGNNATLTVQTEEGDEDEEDSSLSGFSDLLETLDQHKDVHEEPNPEKLKSTKLSFTPKSIKSIPVTQSTSAPDVRKPLFSPKSQFSDDVKPIPTAKVAAIPDINKKQHKPSFDPKSQKSKKEAQATIRTNESTRRWNQLETSSDSSISDNQFSSDDSVYSIQDSSDDEESKFNDDSDSSNE